MKPDTRETQFTKKRYDTTSAIYNLMEWPVEQLWYKKWRKQLWEQVHGPEVLEIGVGTGKNIPFFTDYLQVTAIDLSSGMLKRAKKKLSRGNYRNVSLREMDVQNLNFQNDSFDDVLATFVFCSVPEPVRGLQEALRVTRPGGKLYLMEHMLSKNKSFASVMKKLDAPIHYVTGVHIARETVENVEKAGWKIDQIQDMTSNGIFRMIEATNCT